jgi:hypothetical protein
MPLIGPLPTSGLLDSDWKPDNFLTGRHPGASDAVKLNWREIRRAVRSRPHRNNLELIAEVLRRLGVMTSGKSISGDDQRRVLVVNYFWAACFL